MKDNYYDTAHHTRVALMFWHHKTDPDGRPIWQVSGVEVDPAFRGQGWAGQLLDTVCWEADQQEVTLILQVRPDGTGLGEGALIAMYERRNFRLSPEYPGEMVYVRLPEPMLAVELVPDSVWYSNVRSETTRTEWKRCQEWTHVRSGKVCEICGAIGPRHPVETHETWRYDDQTGVQSLRGLIDLCPDCHRVKHIGRTSTVGGVRGLARSIQRLCEVNGWDEVVADAYLKAMFRQHARRSERSWTLDLSWLERNGLVNDATRRAEAAVRVRRPALR